ncbi:uncharacterized protein LOC111696635 [Eurytemora carolleeae]|uniref:uncharacterized protein LOC111696635 n=1 Tax=Eurytemora carolleeae TaxID=1294199 RepID=UPI000C77B6CB|nr:uncharacterized protein LOC111696635 [Eurytemora carolleeae]|eukprot:XP_023322078.1 uncharacterized protein LOC111696635 [Eurytemora affinis]
MSKIRRCIGFDENVVLAIKSCFYDYDMREIWIKQNESKAVYHSRTCREQFGDDEEILEKVSTSCRAWFNSLTDKEDWRTEELKTNEAELDDPITTATDTEPPEAIEASKNLETEAVSSNLKKIPQQNSKLQFSCSFCSKAFRLKSSLDKHRTRSHRTLIQEQRRHQGGQFFCSFCGLGFDKKPSMQRHISRKHSEESNEGLVGVDVTVSNPVSCSQPGCSHVLHNSSEYKSHLRNVHNLTRRGRRPKEPLDLELAKLLGLGNLLTFLVILYKPIKTFKNIIF